MNFEIVPMVKWWHLEHSLQLARQTLKPDAVISFDDLRQELLHLDAQYYVALVNGGVKAFAGFKKTGINRYVFEFPWCVVHKDYQRQGIGRALTERRIIEVKKRGGELILLSTPVPEIYQRYGFRVFATVPGWADQLMLLSTASRLPLQTHGPTS